jgi:hypothetical protein
MDMHTSSAATRAQFNYGVEGLKASEELLLKSLVRLLAGRTQHQWVYHPQAPDVWILAHGLPAPVSSGPATAPIITVGKTEKQAPDYLNLPLRPNEIEAAFNRVGGTILESRIQATQDTDVNLYPASYKLSRWPRVHLLGSAERMRLATLLLSRPLTLAQLSRQSGLSPIVCEGFIDDLKTTGLIETLRIQVVQTPAIKTTEAQNSSPVDSTAPLSLFARIRNRLNQRVTGNS